MVRKAEHPDHQRSFAIVFGKSGGAILWISLIYIGGRGLISICTIYCRLINTSELRQFGHSAQHIHQIRIRKDIQLQQFAQILHGVRNAVNEVLLALKISS